MATEKTKEIVEEIDEETLQAMVLRDFWPTDNEEDRVRAGSIIEVTKDQMIDGLERGVLARAGG